MKKTLLTALLLSGVSLFAGEPLSINIDKGNEFFKQDEKLSFRKAEPKRNVLKLKQTRFSGSGKDWDEAEMTSSGLFINFGIFFPPTSYLNPYYTSGDLKYNMGINFELGSYFRFAKISEGKCGIGLRATWLSSSYTKLTDDKDIWRAIEISLVRLGPQIGVAINEKMAVDAFYQFGWNITEEFGSIDTGNDETVGASSGFMGLSHEVGAAFRFQVFSLGFGYRFGKLTNFLNYYDGETYDNDEDEKYSVSSLRITLGFKF